MHNRSAEVVNPRGWLATHFPRLYHVAHRDALPSILNHGLMSSERLLRESTTSSSERERLLTELRRESVSVPHRAMGHVVLRDQKPMSSKGLSRCLVGMNQTEWLQLLNSLVFFWPTEKRRDAFLGAKAYRNTEHVVLSIDTSLIESIHGNSLVVSEINSGATLYVPRPRGESTFVPLSKYRSHGDPRRIAEIALPSILSDVKVVLIEADIYKGPRKIRRVHP